MLQVSGLSISALRFRLQRGWRVVALFLSTNSIMAQELVTLECTEAKKEGKPTSRYLTFRNKKTVTERIEKKKYNPFLKRHTVHKEIK
jgi:large subunit ribosomal protein L33